MASVKTYQDRDVVLQYHPNEKIINLRLKPGQNKDGLNRLEDKIKTTLNVDSTTEEGPNSKILKLDQQSVDDMVHEFLQTILEGGEEEEDAQEVGQDAAVEDSEEPAPPPPAPQMGAQPPQPGMQPESLTFTNVFEMLYESTYRTGKYWDDIQQASGKGRQHIQTSDIISMRRMYTKKKRSAGRDKVLRALDKASKYFVRLIRRQGSPQEAEKFKMRYRKIGNLTPLDYAEKTPEDPMMSAGEEEVFDPQSVDFSDFFPSEKDDEEDKEDDEENDIPGPGEEEYPE